jgi:hypothetical protein
VAAAGAVTIFTVVTEEVVAAGTVEVAVNKPKQISMGLVRMSSTLAGKTKPDRVTIYTMSS